MSIKRESKNDEYLILDKNGKKISVKAQEIHNKLGVSGIIRLQKDDFGDINKNQVLLTHFNLESSHHTVGQKYALPKIIEPGYYIDDEHEKLPLLDFRHCPIAECLWTKERVAYEYIDSRVFEYSFPTINDVKSLKEAIIARYSKSLPALNKEEILSLGVGITHLKILHRANFII